ncbi:MAG: hypothetical protein HW379_160 [Actinobacteria bacterium]|jgi:hypothetical protein|nr:hypothetical protein [Actinomycetota bacterium]
MIATQRGWKIILVAVFGGLVLGVSARLWMRWISTDPEFTWSGTIFIVLAFTIFASAQATVYVLRRRIKTRRLTTVIRGGGILLTLPLFTGAGGGMFPTVALASIALWQKKIDSKIRIALLVISLVIPAIGIKGIGSDFGWNIATLGRSLLVIFIYSVVILLLKPTVTPYIGPESSTLAKRRFKKTLTFLSIVLVAFLFLIATGISIDF